MSHSGFIYSTSPISDSPRNGPLFIAPSNITFDYPLYALQPLPPYPAGSTGAIPGHQYDVVQNVEFSPLMGSSGHGSWSNEHPQGHRVDLALNHLHNQALVPYTSNVGHDDQTYPTTGLAEHRGDQTHHGNHHMPVVLGSPQLEYHAPVAPVHDLNNDDPQGYMPLVDSVAGPSRRSPRLVRSGMWDDVDEDLKRLASRYLNNSQAGSYVNEFRMRRRRSGGRKVSITFETDD